MTSRKSFFNFEVMLQSIKQSKYIMILHTVALFLMTTIPMYMRLQEIEKYSRRINYGGELSMWLSGFNPLVCFASVGIPIITAIYLFSYLFKPNSVQFVNSMPCTRGCMYASRFAACAVSLLIPIFIVFAANSVVYVSMGLGEYFPYADIAAGLGRVLLCYFAMLGLCTFAVSISGNFFAVLIVTGFVGLCYLVSTWSVTVSFEAWFENLLIMFSYEPVYIFPPAMLFYGDAQRTLSTACYIYTAAYGIIFFALGLWAYVKRRSENTNKFFAYRGVGVFLKYYVSLVGSTFFGALFLGLSNNNAVIGYIGYILILFVTYAMLQAIFEKDMRSMFSNMKQFAIFAVIWALVLIPLNEGVLEELGPKRENIKAMEVSYGLNEVILREEGNLDAAFELYENAEKIVPKEGNYKVASFITNPDNPVFTIERTRYVSEYRQIYDYENKVFNSEEYKNMLLEALDGDYENAWIDLAFVDYGVMSLKEDTESARYVGEFDLRAEDFDALREKLKGEIVKYDYETCVKSGCFASITISKSKRENYSTTYIPVYLCFEETVRFMKEDLKISPSGADVESIAVYVYSDKIDENGDYERCRIFETSDPEEIDTILSCSSCSFGFAQNEIRIEARIRNQWGSHAESTSTNYIMLSEKAKKLINPEGKAYEELAQQAR